MQAELDNTFGKDRVPRYRDRSETPYTEAVIHEIQRRSSVNPQGIMRWTTADVKIGVFDIPANTMVYGNIWGVSHDPKNFPDPFKFDPTRHIDKDTGRFFPNPRIWTFGMGKRRCLGKFWCL